jgi:hypothetical protein
MNQRIYYLTKHTLIKLVWHTCTLMITLTCYDRFNCYLHHTTITICNGHYDSDIFHYTRIIFFHFLFLFNEQFQV